jgi:hypothetical protein
MQYLEKAIPIQELIHVVGVAKVVRAVVRPFIDCNVQVTWYRSDWNLEMSVLQRSSCPGVSRSAGKLMCQSGQS